jgi:type III secretory pathway lipoprotein EscJ
MKLLTRSLSRLTIIAVLTVLTACRENILHDLPEHEVNRLVSKLHEVGIAATKVKQPEGKWAIAVKNSEVIKSLQILDDSRLLKGINKAEKEKATLISSREEQRARIERALAEQIQATLTSIPGILEAHVHLNLPPVDPLFGQPLGSTTGSASVLLIASQNYEMKSKDIALLVAGAAGLPAEKIAILVSSNGKQGDEIVSQDEIAATVNSDRNIAPNQLWLNNKELFYGIAFLLLGLSGLIVLGAIRRTGRTARRNESFSTKASKDDFMQIIGDKL